MTLDVHDSYSSLPGLIPVSIDESTRIRSKIADSKIDKSFSTLVTTPRIDPISDKKLNIDIDGILKYPD